MKKKILFLTFAFLSTIMSAQTISKDDLHWAIGNYWSNLNFTFDTTSISTKGTNQSWDFTNLIGGDIDTVSVIYSSSFDIKTTSPATGTAEFTETASSFSYSKLFGVSADNPSSLDIGLPRTYGDTYSSSGTVGGFIPINLYVSVPAMGTVTIAKGTYNCILVREKVSGPLTAVNLYWETKEFGRVAVYSSGMIGVMQNTNVVVSTNDIKTLKGFEVFPSPVCNNLSIKSDLNETNMQIKIYTIFGQLLQTEAFFGGTKQVDVSSLESGIYVVNITSNNELLHSGKFVKQL